MAGRFVCNLIHFVWSTQGRREWIAESWEEQLHAYIGGIANNKNATLIAAGGMPDHLHLLVSMPPTVSVSDMVNVLKIRGKGSATRRDVGSDIRFVYTSVDCKVNSERVLVSPESRSGDS